MRVWERDVPSPNSILAVSADARTPMAIEKKQGDGLRKGCALFLFSLTTSTLAHAPRLRDFYIVLTNQDEKQLQAIPNAGPFFARPCLHGQRER